MPRQLTIDYPDTLPDVLQESAEQFEQEARMAMAVKLYEMQRISSGVAAQIAGIDRVDFLLGLSRYGISMMNFDASELETDVLSA
jgi:predicted HTH domain antitoxin